MCFHTFFASNLMQPKSLLSIPLLFLAATTASSQGQSASSFQQRINQTWDLVYTRPDSVFDLAKKLESEAEIAGSYKGQLNATQLIGESYYMMGRLDSAFHYYSLAMDLATAEGDRNEIGHTHTSLAGISADRGERDVAIYHFNQSLQLRVNDQDSIEICDVAVRYANCLGDSDMPQQAMEKYLLGLKYCRAIADELTIAHAYNGMAIVHKKQRNFDKALELLDSARFYYARLGEDLFVASVLNNRGVLKKQLGRYAEAGKDYQEGLEAMEAAGYDRGIMSFNQNLGILANIQREPDLALMHCGKALQMARDIDIPMTISEALNEIAKSYLMKNELSTAESSIDESIEVAQRIKSLEKEHQAWETKSRIHKAQGRSDLALAAYEQFVMLNDSIFRLEKTAEIDRLQTEYETKKKEGAIAHLQAEARLDNERKKWLLIGWVAMVIAALAVITSIVFKRRKDRSVLQAQIELKDSENLRLAEQLNHKRRELTEKALHLAQKNELLQSLKTELDAIRTSEVGMDVKAISNKIRFDQQIDNNWDQFTKAFTETNVGFFDRLREKHPDVTKNELRLSALLSMHLSSKEIGAILNISDEGVRKARYRLRKKLVLSTEDKLDNYLAQL
jgi:tetratricopeptide (TPR) repeat protein